MIMASLVDLCGRLTTSCAEILPLPAESLLCQSRQCTAEPDPVVSFESKFEG